MEIKFEFKFAAMNSTLKTVLLTILTLSVFAIALIEINGISAHSIFNLWKKPLKMSEADQAQKDSIVRAAPKTTMIVPNIRHSFGKIKEGDKVRHTWKIRNTGSNPLLISNITVSCGCTAPYYSKEPIEPGKESDIVLEFNSKNKSGHVEKNALIVCNTDNSPFSIGFDADVE